MRYALIMLALTCAASRLDAQAARIGRQPLLTEFSGNHLECLRAGATAAMRRQGIDSVLSIRDREHQRLVGVGVDRRGKVRFFDAMIGANDGRRRESEGATVFFTEDGTIQKGDRRAFTTGTPSRLSEDRKSGLLPGDTIAVRRLAESVVRRCRG